MGKKHRTSPATVFALSCEDADLHHDQSLVPIQECPIGENPGPAEKVLSKNVRYKFPGHGSHLGCVNAGPAGRHP